MSFCSKTRCFFRVLGLIAKVTFYGFISVYVWKAYLRFIHKIFDTTKTQYLANIFPKIFALVQHFGHFNYGGLTCIQHLQEGDFGGDKLSMRRAFDFGSWEIRPDEG